jgi:hypothetical protein
MSGRELRSGDHPCGGRGRTEWNRGVAIARAVRRVATLAIMLTGLLTLVQIAAAQAEPQPVGVPGTWGIRLNEEFSGSSLNTALWTPGWHHIEPSGTSGPMSGDCLSSENVSQNGNGYLYLKIHTASGNVYCEYEGQKASQTVIGGLVESAPGDGHGGFSYKEGYVEWRAYLPGVAKEGCPTGGCLPDWPALWSLPENHESEIDTMEGLETLGKACFHLPPPFGTEAPGRCLTGSYAGWHTYGARWEGNVVTWYYDGVEVGQLGSSYLIQPHYLVMDIINPTHGEPASYPTEMTVDYVRVWQHPAPSVTTTAASNIGEEQAQLNGTVNPNGTDAKYHFEYGTTTSYGSSTSEGDAGSGTGTVVEQSVVTNVHPETTYHYRIVATNSSGGISRGSDQTFKTLTPSRSSTWTVSDPYTAEEWLYYVGSERAIWQWHWNGTSYEDYKVGGEVAAGTTPTVLRNEETGHQWVYYVGKNEHAIWQSYWNGTTWESSKVGGQVAENSSVAAVFNPATGYPSIYYIGATSHVIWQFYWNGTAYGSATIGGEAAPNTSPAIDRDPSYNGAVYVVGKDKAIWQFYWTGSAWSYTRIGGEAASNTSPAVAFSTQSNVDSVYYVGRTESAIWQWYWNGTTWVAVKVGGTLAPNTGIAVARDPAAGGGLYVLGTDDSLWQFYWTGTAWSYYHIGGQAATGTPLAAVLHRLQRRYSLEVLLERQ